MDASRSAFSSTRAFHSTSRPPVRKQAGGASAVAHASGAHSSIFGTNCGSSSLKPTLRTLKCFVIWPVNGAMPQRSVGFSPCGASHFGSRPTIAVR